MGNNQRSRRKGRGNDAMARETGNRERVYNAIVDLCGSGRPATRKAIADHLSLSLAIVDDHVKNLKADELIAMVVPGIFEPATTRPDRDVSGTYVAGGVFKLEIGDQVLDLTPREVLNVARLTGGHALLAGR